MLQKNSLLLLISLLFCFSSANAQTGKTFAVVVGISQYQNPLIPKLRYADKDARLFADWLKSKAGGSVPDYQVRLFTNEQATVAAIYESLDWLKKTARENDIICLYFSGHGDVEVNDSSSQGYLLAFNSPPNNYRNNAIAVVDINADANICTIHNKANVILITDACHSGKLAGDFYKGKQLTANNLQLVLNNQVRLASCKTDQEAAEGIEWGGGRGVFSYYLLMGLNGLADKQNEGLVRLKSLDAFLDSAFAADKTLLSNKHQQNPVTDGNPNYPLAIVDPATQQTQKNNNEINTIESVNLPAGLQSLKPLGLQPLDGFFSVARQISLEEFDFNAYIKLPADSFPLNFMKDYMLCQEEIVQKTWTATYYDEEAHPSRSGYRSLAKTENLEHLFRKLDDDKLKLLKNQLVNLNPVINRFNHRFVNMMHEKGQDMINAYLKGDIAELEKRQYYSTGNRSYGNFVSQLKLAIKLVPENNHLAHLLNVQLNYISGLIDRLKTATSIKTDSLVFAALRHQRRALALDPYAAYIHNELGNLFFQQKKYDSADYHFSFATALTPTWAIPWSNKVRLNLAVNKIEKAKNAFQQAELLQPDLAYVAVNAGLVMEKDADLLAAETYYLKALEQNNVHYLPYERLGNIYTLLGEYALADYYLYEAKKRKDEFAVNSLNFAFGIEMGGEGPLDDIRLERENCFVRSSNADSRKNAFISLAMGIQNSDTLNTDLTTAAENLTQAIKQQPGILLAHHYLGKVLLKQGKWLEANEALKNAINNFKTNQEVYYSLQKSLLHEGATRSDSCLLQFLLNNRYDILDDHFMLAFALEKLERWDEAIGTYQSIADIENRRQLKQAVFAEFLTDASAAELPAILQTTATQIRDKPFTYRIDKPFDANFFFDGKGLEIVAATRPGRTFIQQQFVAPAPSNRNWPDTAGIISFTLYNDEISLSHYPGDRVININISAYYRIPLSERRNLAEYNTPMHLAGSIKAARLLEQTGKYKQAEEVLLKQVAQNQEAGFLRESENKLNLYWLTINEEMEAETHHFYNRMMKRFPRDYRWKESAGMYLYKRLRQTFIQIPLSEQQAFYESMNWYAYPFLTSIEDPRKSEVIDELWLSGDIHIKLPGTGELLTIIMQPYDPVKEALDFLTGSTTLSGDAKPAFYLLEALADLNSWMGNRDEAISQFAELVSRQPADAKLRNKLVAYLQLCNRFTQTREHLLILHEQGQLNNGQLLQLVAYQVQGGNFISAKALIKEYRPRNKEEENKKFTLLARLYSLSGKPQAALVYLRDSIKPVEAVETADYYGYERNIKVMLATAPAIFKWYTLARMYALLNNEKKALQALKLAIDSGFIYKYVLDSDPVWTAIKAKTAWRTLIQQYKFEEIDYPGIIDMLSAKNYGTISYRVPKKNLR